MNLTMVELSLDNLEQFTREEDSGLPTLDQFQWHERRRREDTLMRRIGLVTEDHQLVGYAHAVTGSWDPVLRPGYFELQIHVHPSWRNKGIGNRLLEETTRFAKRHGGHMLQTTIPDSRPDELAWATKYGFRQETHMYASELVIADLPESCWQSVVEAERHGIRFGSLANLPDPDASFDQFSSFYWDLALDTPNMRDFPRPTTEYMRRTLDGAFHPEGVLLAFDNDLWVAMCVVIPHEGDIYYNNLTGVHRSYRGQGLGMAIKIKGIDYAMRQGANRIRTDNDSTNVPMLAINKRMGYQPRPGIFRLIKEL